jgi:peptide/nickel transport system substrate-binding protein
MANRPRWLNYATLGVVAALLVLACQPAGVTPGPTATGVTTPAPVVTPAPVETPEGTPEVSPEGTPGATPYPDALEQPGDVALIADSYPNYGGEVDCENGTFNGRPYAGKIKSITAPDPMTVVFTLCSPDVAFLAKVAFTVFAINDSDFLIAHTAAGDIQDVMNGTGPFVLDQWQRGTELDYSRFDGYWGDAAATASAVLRWATDAATRLTDLQAGTVHGITNVGRDDFETVRSDANLQLLEQAGLNTLYVGMNHDVEPWSIPEVRQAIAVGVNRQRIVDNFMPPGSEVASQFTPCQIPFGCTGDPWPDYNPDAARQLLADAGFPDGFETTIAYRNVARGYLPDPPGTATDLQAQLADIGITATLDEQESGTFIDNSNNGALTGLFLLGWGADYPDVTNFLDFHFGQGATPTFGQPYPEIYESLNVGSQTADDAAREAAYVEANNAIREQVPMLPVSHSGFANAYLADVDGAQVSPLSNELLFRMTPPGGGDQIVFDQNAEPLGLYCADESDGESLRACEQSMEALYGYEQDGTATVPVLATECAPNEDLSVWTCTLREGVTFHDGATFEAKDVIASFAAQWDAISPLHVGRAGVFVYWSALWGDFLNPPGPCGLSNTAPCE